MRCFTPMFISVDFAVGAPFHETGKVYIWMGSKKGISVEPSQVTNDFVQRIHFRHILKEPTFLGLNSDAQLFAFYR